MFDGLNEFVVTVAPTEEDRIHSPVIKEKADLFFGGLRGRRLVCAEVW